MIEQAIVVDKVDFAYNGSAPVLSAVDLMVKKGEFLGLVGPNGGGKTTLLKLIMGLLQPRTGTISVFDRTPKSARKLMGYVPQFSTFLRDFPITVENVVQMGRLGIKKIKQEKEVVYGILQKVDIEKLSKRSLHELSGGQLQRIMIARALACEPQLLLLDEPTANIDIHGERNLFELLQKINEEGITILLVSHDIGFISNYIKRVACINQRLICHQTAHLDGELMHSLYAMPVSLIKH